MLELAQQISDLTETAQDVLKTELAARQLTMPADGVPEVSSGQGVDPVELGRFALLSAADCIWEFTEDEDAQAAAEMLIDAGIPCDVIVPSADRLDMRAPRIAVLPRDKQRAQQILSQPILLSQPIPEEFRVLVRTRDQFILPTCPACGAIDPLLESINQRIPGSASFAVTFGKMSF